MHWSYVFLALTHGNGMFCFVMFCLPGCGNLGCDPNPPMTLSYDLAICWKQRSLASCPGRTWSSADGSFSAFCKAARISLPRSSIWWRSDCHWKLNFLQSHFIFEGSKYKCQITWIHSMTRQSATAKSNSWNSDFNTVKLGDSTCVTKLYNHWFRTWFDDCPVLKLFHYKCWITLNFTC